VDIWWKRGIIEELGDAVDLDRFEFEALNVFIANTVGEFGVFGILKTDYSVGDLSEIRNKTSRDRAREFRGELIDVPANPADIINFALGQRNSVNAFVSYTPHLIDMLLLRLKAINKSTEA